jgi:single-strand DNA-binding protein
MATFHELEIVGNLGADPEMSYTPEATAKTTFRMAAQTGRGEYKGTIWFRITFWGGQAEAINAHCGKGDLVCVKGELEHDENGRPMIWKGKEDGLPHASFDVRGRVCQFLNLKNGGGSSSQEEYGDWEPGTAKKKPSDVPF